MRSRNVIIGLTLVLAVFLLAIGYATISNVTLNVSGNASATASDANFKVKFDSSVTPTTENATASITGDKTATIAVTGLTTKGDTATATYTVKNESTDLKAGLTANITSNTNTNYFKVTYEFAKTEISAGESTTITVTVKLLKTLIADQTATIGIKLTAEPKQAGTTSGGGSSTGGNTSGGNTVISETESYVGRYADMDGDGTVDGIIYADLAFSKSESGYSYTAESNLKEYYIIEEGYTDDFGEQDVIASMEGTTGNDRFYVMALDDFTTTDYDTFYWYYNAYENMSDYATATSEDFGTGKSNTITMISYWNDSTYGAQNARDMWGVIQNSNIVTSTSDSGKWFVPSEGEWKAFFYCFGIGWGNSLRLRAYSLELWNFFPIFLYKS